MKHYIQIIIAIVSFIFLTIPLAILDVLMKLLGLPMVLISLPFSKIDKAPEWEWRPNGNNAWVYEGWQYERLPYPFDYIWGNWTYGAQGNYILKDQHPLNFWQKYHWLAIRNSASRWSYYPIMRYKAHSDNIRYLGSPKIDDNNGITGWRFTWDVTCPWRSGIVILKRYGNSNRAFWLRFGWLQYSDEGEHIPTIKSMFIPHFYKEIPKPSE